MNCPVKALNESYLCRAHRCGQVGAFGKVRQCSLIKTLSSSSTCTHSGVSLRDVNEFPVVCISMALYSRHCKAAPLAQRWSNDNIESVSDFLHFMNRRPVQCERGVTQRGGGPTPPPASPHPTPGTTPALPPVVLTRSWPLGQGTSSHRHRPRRAP